METEVSNQPVSVYKTVRIHEGYKEKLDELSGLLGMPRSTILAILIKSLHENYQKLDTTLSGIVTSEFAELRKERL